MKNKNNPSFGKIMGLFVVFCLVVAAISGKPSFKQPELVEPIVTVVLFLVLK